MDYSNTPFSVDQVWANNPYGQYKNGRDSHVSNYSGVFETGRSYQKFDFVHNTGDGLYYYAKENIVDGAGIILSGDYRFTLDPDGPLVNGRPTHYIYDSFSELGSLGYGVEEGQQVEILGSLSGANGLYKVIDVSPDFDSIPYDKIESLDPIKRLDLTPGAIPNFYNSSWFMIFDKGEGELEADYRSVSLFPPAPNWVFMVSLATWVYVQPANPEGVYVKFGIATITPEQTSPPFLDCWLWFSPQYIGSSSANHNSLVYNFADNGISSLLGSQSWLSMHGVPVDNWSDGRPELVFYNYTDQLWFRLQLRGNEDPLEYPSFEVTVITETKDLPIEPINPDVDRLSDNLSSRIQIQGVSESTQVTDFEAANDYEITIKAINASPSSTPDTWTKDLFFFDADYGSTVNFKINTSKNEFGNGYYSVQPNTINAISFEANLQFKNRTNRESNAIIHFLENHLGQLEKDKSSSFLPYKQGISGFRWDGNATFHPYDNIDNQTKTFYCKEFNHSLNFENSNDISVKLINLNTSLLNKSKTLFVSRPDDYDENEFYSLNDVVFSPENHKYYYWHSDVITKGKSPSSPNFEWTREGGNYKDENTEYWTREFFWKPSIGLNVNQSPRLNEISLGLGYKQIYADGINESLLELDLKFENRSDSETYAILHFLEQHYGCIPFLFSPPPPYEKPLNFICDSWSHTYNYKDNHSITAKFMQFPFNFSAQDLDASSSTPSESSNGELIFRSPLTFTEKQESDLTVSRSMRKRMFIENIGDAEVANISVNTSPPFRVMGYTYSPIIMPDNLDREDYMFLLNNNSSLPFNLANKKIKLLKKIQEGVEGGQYFDEMYLPQGEIDDKSNWVPVMIDGLPNRFFQNNFGQIKSGVLTSSPSSFENAPYFMSEIFNQTVGVSSMQGLSDGYVEIMYDGSLGLDETLLIDSDSNQLHYDLQDGSSGPIEISISDNYHTANIVVVSNGLYSPQTGEAKVYITS